MLRIALIGDLHFFRMEERYQPHEEIREARRQFFETFLRKFLQYEADWHISIGDLTHGGHLEEFEELYPLINASGVNFRLVFGNHDVQALPKEKVSALTRQVPYEAVETEAGMMIFLDTTKEMWTRDWGGEVAPQQLAWLREQIARSGSRPVYVFAHHPVWNTTTDSTEKWFSINPQTDIQSVLSNKQGAGFYFNGHNHVHSVVRQGQWTHIQTAATLCYPVFRCVVIDEGKVSIKDVIIEDGEMVKGWNLLREKFSSFYFVERSRASGTPNDRALAINI